MPRLFAGIEIPEALRLRLSLIGGPLPGAKWVAAEDMHITLRFAGDIDNRTADEFADFLSGIEIEPFEVRIGDLGAFGGRDPRVIYVGVDGGESLESLRRAVDRAARSAGLPPEPRTFRAHVTLARLKGASSEAVARFLASRGRVTADPFVADRFVLFSSKPKVGGGPYVVEAVYPLG